MHPLVGALLEAGDGRRWSRCFFFFGPVARQAAAWAGALALAVSVASFAPEAAFVWALSGGGGGGCAAGAVRVPLDGGGDHLCVPARMAGRTCADLIVPPAFAALSVGASACFVRALSIGRRRDDS
ncbi:uncharacterized protein LOC100846558 [Brachypodium distachyon]|uniref:Uncharacterized protein n=1 Tax=Brachypodium distachyon TaxID=15368 RepID=A0A0Q3IJ79_BRADI|nr:uncharacterized protein LOC100846558 [Brachypodium distachyon]KQJ86264.1 hypothetical protein BRADI_4g04344v3 [Brachypodium distachyon]|eukprot:XP_003579288.1 uncharacterized protein LOC100846558 [Brachypodium distachyon]